MKHWGMPGVPHHRRPTPRGMATMLAAQAALYGHGDPLTQADALAVREQLRRSTNDAMQRELPLVERGRG